MATRRSSRTWLTLALAQALWLIPAGLPARADDPKPEKPEPKAEETTPAKQSGPTLQEIQANPEILLKEPVRWRVFQRDANNRADIPIAVDPKVGAYRLMEVSLTLPQLVPAGFGRQAFAASAAPLPVPYRDGKLLGVPTGGPYHVNLTIAEGTSQAAPGGPIAPAPRVMNVAIGPVFVGDLWVLAGQSNMEGVGNLEEVTPPADRVAVLGMDGRWSQAEEPLHWLVDSPDPVHSGDPATREQRSKEQHKTRRKGSGLGLPFAAIMAASTGVPVGLVATAHGGTSMGQWDPSKKDQGGQSLYGSMLRQVKLAGGRVRGVLWYQGESDAMGQGEPWKEYAKNMVQFIASVREDFQDPDLPFLFVQIGRFVIAHDSKGWNAVQDAQRKLPDRVPNTAVVASIDLELDDLIHVGTPGLKRLGARLARVAQRELFGLAGATTPTFERVNRRDDTTLVVRFKGVNRGSVAHGGPAPAFPGFAAAAPAPPAPPAPGAASPGQALTGLQPSRHIAGFSIRKEDGTEIPLIYDAAVGPSKDTVILRLVTKPPEGAKLWYGYGLDPYCNLTDTLDMAVPAFGPIALDESD